MCLSKAVVIYLLNYHFVTFINWFSKQIWMHVWRKECNLHVNWSELFPLHLGQKRNRHVYSCQFLPWDTLCAQMTPFEEEGRTIRAELEGVNLNDKKWEISGWAKNVKIMTSIKIPHFGGLDEIKTTALGPYIIQIQNGSLLQIKKGLSWNVFHFYEAVIKLLSLWKTNEISYLISVWMLFFTYFLTVVAMTL